MMCAKRWWGNHLLRGVCCSLGYLLFVRHLLFVGVFLVAELSAGDVEVGGGMEKDDAFGGGEGAYVDGCLDVARSRVCGCIRVRIGFCGCLAICLVACLCCVVVVCVGGCLVAGIDEEAEGGEDILPIVPAGEDTEVVLTDDERELIVGVGGLQSTEGGGGVVGAGKRELEIGDAYTGDTGNGLLHLPEARLLVRQCAGVLERVVGADEHPYLV